MCTEPGSIAYPSRYTKLTITRTLVGCVLECQCSGQIFLPYDVTTWPAVTNVLILRQMFQWDVCIMVCCDLLWLFPLSREWVFVGKGFSPTLDPRIKTMCETEQNMTTNLDQSWSRNKASNSQPLTCDMRGEKKKKNLFIHRPLRFKDCLVHRKISSKSWWIQHTSVTPTTFWSYMALLPIHAMNDNTC